MAILGDSIDDSKSKDSKLTGGGARPNMFKATASRQTCIHALKGVSAALEAAREAAREHV